MASSSPELKTASSFKGSLATKLVILGPGLSIYQVEKAKQTHKVPQFPVNTALVEVEANDLLSTSLRFPDARTDTFVAPIVGDVPVDVIMITSVSVDDQLPL